MHTNHSGRTGALLLAVIFAVATPAAAQNDADHLTCYKVKDPLKLKGTLDLDTAGLGLSSDCQISKAKMLCAPSDARNVDDGSGTSASSSGPRAATERVCYKVKCPAPYPAPQEVTDAFGTRTLEKFKTSMVCTPATAAAPVLQNGLEHRARGLAQLVEGGDAVSGATLHVLSLDGRPTGEPDSSKSSSSDPGGGGVVVVLQASSSYGVSVADGLNSRASLRTASLRAGAVLNVRGISREESTSMFDLVSVDGGTAGVSSTAYFPRLQRTQPAPQRTGIVTCQGQLAGAHVENVAGDPDWTWFSTIWPDRYETSSGATSDEAVFEWDNGCVPITVPDGSGSVYVGDRLVISADNGANPRLMKRAEVTGGGGLSRFTIKDEAVQ